jgi:hypothetical protein
MASMNAPTTITSLPLSFHQPEQMLRRNVSPAG